MTYRCPVCGYPGLERPPADYEICPCCGTEFDYHDALRSHQSLRQEWIRGGLGWHSRVDSPPAGWNAYMQLIKAGFQADLPHFDVRAQADSQLYVTRIHTCSNSARPNLLGMHLEYA